MYHAAAATPILYDDVDFEYIRLVILRLRLSGMSNASNLVFLIHIHTALKLGPGLSVTDNPVGPVVQLEPLTQICVVCVSGHRGLWQCNTDPATAMHWSCPVIRG